MNTKYNDQKKLKEKITHYKTQLRNYKDKCDSLQSQNIKLRKVNSQLFEKNAKLESTIKEQKRIITENEEKDRLWQKNNKKEKTIDTVVQLIYFVGEFIILTILTYDISIKPVGDCFVYVIITALLLVLIHILIHVFSGYKSSSLLTPFTDLIPSIIQSFLPLMAVSLLLWAKQSNSLQDYLSNNIELMTVLGLTIIVFAFIAAVITVFTYMILGAIHLIRMFKASCTKHTDHDS